MQTINVTAPLKYAPGELTEDTTFNVQPSYNSTDYAVTIEGNWKTNLNPYTEDRRDGIWPRIIINAAYKSKGLRIYAADNADFAEIQVSESLGTALELKAMRQCNFLGAIRLHRCQSTDAIFRITGDPNRYSTNMLNFSQVICMANDAPRTIEFLTVAGAKNRTRIINIGQLLCHPSWPTLQAQFPGTVSFNERQRVHLYLDADDVTVSSFNFRLDPNDPTTARAVQAEQSCVRVVLLSGQVLRRRTDDAEDFIETPATVTPGNASVSGVGQAMTYRKYRQESINSVAGPVVVNPFLY